MSRRNTLLVLSLVLAACGGTGADSSTTSTSRTSSTPTTTVATATTTTEAPAEECEPTPIEGRGQIWEAGCAYTASSFLVPITFVGADGWSSIGAADTWVGLKYDADDDGIADATLTFIAYRPDSSPDEIMGEITAFDGVNPTTATAQAEIGDRPVMTLDVIGVPDTRPLFEPCSSPPKTALMKAGGYLLITTADWGIGIPNCYPTRVWVVDVDRQQVTILGAVDNSDALLELGPGLEDLLQNNVIFGDADE